MPHDTNTFHERLDAIKRNLRNLAATECADAADLLRRDDLLEKAISGALGLYDDEIHTKAQDITQIGGKANAYQHALAYIAANALSMSTAAIQSYAERESKI